MIKRVKTHDLEEESGSTVGGIAGYMSGANPKKGVYRSDIEARERKFPRKKAKRAQNRKKNKKKKIPPNEFKELTELRQIIREELISILESR